jgi:DNA-binding NarL/FixJ family response regulator
MPDRRVRRETRTVEEVFDAHDALGTEALAGGLEAATRLWDRASGGMLSRDASDHAPVEPLSGQERGIQTLLAGGKEPATIAQQLGISGRTLRNHLHHIIGGCAPTTGGCAPTTGWWRSSTLSDGG